MRFIAISAMGLQEWEFAHEYTCMKLKWKDLHILYEESDKYQNIVRKANDLSFKGVI